MKKLSLVLFPIFFCLLSHPVFSQQSNGDGFLAISARVGWEYYNNQKPPYDFVYLPITFTGVSSNYEIVSHLEVSPELLHASEYYKGDSSFLSPGEIQPFSFANFELQYLAKRISFLNISLGVKIGHYGFLSSDWKNPAYTLFAAPTLNLFTFLGNQLMFSIPLEIPIGLYLNNIKDFFYLRTGFEVTFDTNRNIANPLPRSILLSLGVEYNYLKLTTLEAFSGENNYIKPYLKISFLY